MIDSASHEAHGDPHVLALEAELIARFADDVAHEVRNPLNALVINIEVLRRRIMSGDAEAALDRVDVLDREVRRVHDIVEHLITLLRPPKPAEPTADLGRALDDVLPLLELRAGALRSRLDPPGPVDVDVRMPIDRVRFVLLDAGMAALDRAGRDGHLSCMARSDAESCYILLRGRAAEGSVAADPDDHGPRLARAILVPVGGSVDVRTGDDGRFDIHLSLPTVA